MELYQVFDIYGDAELTIKLESFDLGETEFEVGLTTLKSFWMKNISSYVIKDFGLNFSNKSDFKIIKCPTEFLPGEAKELRLAIRPSLSLFKPLKTELQVEGDIQFSDVKAKMELEMPENLEHQEFMEGVIKHTFREYHDKYRRGKLGE